MKAPLRYAACVVAVAIATPAGAQTIDFESTPVGALAEGTTIGGITFFSALGTGLEVANYGVQSDGLGLAVRNDTNGNFLRGSIAGGANFLSFDFGNDDAFFTTLSDIATLRVFSGATFLDTVTVALNRDDIMNQSIAYSGLFDNFTFAFTDAAGNPFTGGGATAVGLIETVDNFRLTPQAAVPEPSTWTMLLLGFGAIGLGMRRRKARLGFAGSFA